MQNGARLRESRKIKIFIPPDQIVAMAAAYGVGTADGVGQIAEIETRRSLQRTTHKVKCPSYCL